MIIGLFEATKTTRQALAKSLIEILDKCGLMKNTIAYVSNEGSNFNATIGVLKFIVNCESLGIKENFQGICFWTCIFKSMSIWHCRGKNMQKFEICFYRVCPSIFASMHHLAEKVWEGQTRME